MSETVTIASYLKTRLEQLGLGAMFGVAGNYTAGFLDTILADPDSSIRISTNANEICAGYAADAYARYNGIGALYVTYSVGAFSLLNTIAGSFVEQVPPSSSTVDQRARKPASSKTPDSFTRTPPDWHPLTSVCSGASPLLPNKSQTPHKPRIKSTPRSPR
jgi:hypothetical protein